VSKLYCRIRFIRLFLLLAWRDWETGSLLRKSKSYRLPIRDAWIIARNIWLKEVKGE
jgi:hypothetical protein